MKYEYTHLSAMVFILTLLTIVQIAYACGVCNTMMLIYIIPIFIPFFILFLLYGIIASIIVKSIGLAITIAGVWLVCLVATITFPSGPIPVILSTIYSFVAPNKHLREVLMKDQITEEKFKIMKATLYKLRLVTLLMAVLIGVGWQIYAPVYFNQNLMKMLKGSALPTTGAAADRLKAIKDPSERAKYLPELAAYLKEEKQWGQRHVWDILAAWEDSNTINIVAKLFEESKYEVGYSRTSLLTTEIEKSAKTLTKLDKRRAAELLPVKLKKILADTNYVKGKLDRAVISLMLCIVNTGDTSAMAVALTENNMELLISYTRYTNSGDDSRAALKALGAPSHGQNSDAYRRWWEHEGKKEFEFLN